MAEIPTKRVVKGLIADDAGDLLIVRRTLDRVWNPGGWDLIGGTVAAGEGLAEAISREGGEEADHDGNGLKIAWRGLVCVFKDFDEVPRQQIVDTSVFEGGVEGTQPKPSLNPVEHTESLWLPLPDLLEVDDLPEQFKHAALEHQAKLATLLD